MKFAVAGLAIALCLSFIEIISAQKKVFCYYSSAARMRSGAGQFLPEDIDTSLCTHVIFAFIQMEGQTQVRAADPSDYEYYPRTVALKKKNPQLRVLLAIGGWKIGSEPFVPMMKTEWSRRAWVKNVIIYLRKHGFDGIDMDWEFPGVRGSPPEDKHRFTLMMKDLQNEMAAEAQSTGNEKMILTLATASGSYYISQSYETAEIHKHLDYMLLMTYNYHGSWEKTTGHHSGLYKSRMDPPGEQEELHQQWSIDFWLRQGVPKSKLIVGIATYGMSYTLADPRQNGVRAPAAYSDIASVRAGNGGPLTHERGVLSYFEICRFIRDDGWTRVWLDDMLAPYATKGNQWVGYDDPESLTYKANNIMARDLAGAFVWSVETDDFSGMCGQGRYPLLNKITSILKPYSVQQAPAQEWKPAEEWKPEPESVAFQATTTTTAKPTKWVWKPQPTQKPWVWKPQPTQKPWVWKPQPTQAPVMPPPVVAPVLTNQQAQGVTMVNCVITQRGFHPHPDCGKFVVCSFSHSYTMSCPPGTLYDKAHSLCNFPDLVQC